MRGSRKLCGCRVAWRKLTSFSDTEEGQAVFIEGDFEVREESNMMIVLMFQKNEKEESSISEKWFKTVCTL